MRITLDFLAVLEQWPLLAKGVAWTLALTAISALERLLARGVASGVFRPDLRPLDVHSFISALCFFNVSNRHTFGVIFQDRASQDKAETLKREHVVDLILRFVSHHIQE